MDIEHKLTRRHFFRDCAFGVGKTALASMLAESLLDAANKGRDLEAKADRVIFMFMAGGPSQLELFDYKPELVKWDGKPTPDSFVKGKRFAFMDTSFKDPSKLLASRRTFQQYGNAGMWFSDLVPHMASVADEWTMLHGIAAENFNHGPAKLYVNTGSTRTGRPSMGSWISYGIGSESKDLPGFVVLQSGPRGPRGGAVLWSSGFLPTSHQGVPFRSVGDPILNLSTPKRFTDHEQREALDAIRDLNQMELEATGDDEISTRINQYEMAYRMQSSGPELIDFKQESAATLEMYGAEPGKSSYANNCLLARRLVERGVRFVQIYHTDWDHHDDITKPLDKVVAEVDKPSAALIKDLKQRGLLDRTLVVWSGEFGRTPMGEVREKGKIGRNHHIDAFTVLMAGGGLKPGYIHGSTDEFGFNPTGQKMNVHDVQATILNQLGLNHLKLTYRYQGRDFRLTDVEGEVISSIVS